MLEKTINLDSYFGVRIQSEYIDQNSNCLAVILPGQGYTNSKPLLHFSTELALQFGFDVLCVDYGFQVSKEDFQMEKHLDIIISESKAIISKCLSTTYEKIVFIGKSLGTIVQNELSEQFKNINQIHIYLTPINKTMEKLVSHPSLAISGTKDTMISSENIKKLKNIDTVKLVVIEGGNHSLKSENLLNTLDILKTTVVEMKDFLSLN